jgi:hypothetical protein
MRWAITHACEIFRRVVDYELIYELELAAAAELESEAGSEALRAGIRLLDRWRDRSYGAVLFWVDGELGLISPDRPALHFVQCGLVNGVWRSRGSGGTTTQSASELLAERGPGLHRLGGGSAGDPVPLTDAIASPEVSTIELRSEARKFGRRPGIDGFCLFGITHQDPVTYAHALDATGDLLPGDPLLL